MTWTSSWLDNKYPPGAKGVRRPVARPWPLNLGTIHPADAVGIGVDPKPFLPVRVEEVTLDSAC